MESLTFSPKQSTDDKPDKIAEGFYAAAKYLFVLAAGISPLFFVPSAPTPFEYSKILFVFLAIFGSLVLYGLASLRSGVLHLQITIPVLLFWFVVIASSVAALFSRDLTDSFMGATISSQTVVFLALLGLIMTVSQLFLNSKKIMMQLYLLLYGSAVILGLYHIIRVIFGPEVLSFGLSTNELFSPIGNWNDLAIFFGLIVILSIVVLEQLPLPKAGQYFFAGIGVLSIGILTVVQFTAVWMLVGFIGVVALMFSLTRHRFNAEYQSSSSLSILLSAGVALFALVFLIAGSTVGNYISQTTGIEYLEVRPSLAATIGIAQGVYSENAFTGTGPNKFADAWRLHRDQSLNDTVFWNTDFVAGRSYVTTMFTTSGAFATLAWLAFFGSFIYIGYRMFIRKQRHDPFWYFVGTSSFLAATYLWVLAIIYMPGSVIMILAALCTGIALTSYCNLCTVPVLNFDSTQSRQATAVLITGVLAVIVASVTASYNLATHYQAAYTFNTALAASSLEESNERLDRAYSSSPHASYARQRALNAIAELNQLLEQIEPDEASQEQFEQALIGGVTAAQRAITLDETDAQNWAVQAAVYSALVAADIDQAAERAYESIEEAQRLYPTNPEYHALEAQIAFRADDTERAREAVNDALRLKSNYLAALSLFAEIEILAGNIDAALESVEAMVRLQPNNPGLRYQQAVLHLARDDQGNAIRLLEEAVDMDADFANARYVLALQYVEQDRTDEAIEHLEHVSSLNPDNQDVIDLIERLENGEPIDDLVEEEPEPGPFDETFTGTETDPSQSAPTPDTDLIQPVNTPPGEEEETTPPPDATIGAPEPAEDDDA